MSQEKIPYITSDENKKPENQIKLFDVNQMIPGFEIIKEASKVERCEVSIDTLKSGIKIPDERTLESVKKQLKENNIFDLSNFQFESANFNGATSLVLKLTEDEKTIHIYLDKGNNDFLQKIGSIESGGEYQKLINVFDIGNSENFINKTSVSDVTNLECKVETLNPGSGVLDPIREKEAEQKLQAIRDADAIAKYEVELKKQEYTVQKGDTLINIVKKKYGLKFNKSALNAVEEIVKYNLSKNINLTDDTNPKDGVRGDKLQIGQILYLPENLEIIQSIKNEDKERRIAFNKAKGIKMKKNFK